MKTTSKTQSDRYITGLKYIQDSFMRHPYRWAYSSTLTCTQYSSKNPHKNTKTTNSSDTSVYNVWQFRQTDICICNVAGNTRVQKWSTATWLITFSHVAPMKSKWMCFAWKSTKSKCYVVSFCKHQLQVLKQKLKDLKATKMQEGWQQCRSCITTYKSRAESCCAQ